MAILDTLNRLRTFGQYLRGIGPPAGLTKVQIAAAVNAADDWIDANAASFNTALPVAFRTAASPAQKAALIAYLCMRRAGILRAEED